MTFARAEGLDAKFTRFRKGESVCGKPIIIMPA